MKHDNGPCGLDFKKRREGEMTMLFCRARYFYTLTARIFSLLLFLGLFSGQVFADSGRGMNLYEVWVPVDNQSASQRQDGFRRGFDIVLKRLTGRTDLKSVPGIADARQQVSHLVSQFNYSDQPEAKQELTGQRYQLDVRFSESAINQLLRENNLPLWGGGRPPVLVWLAKETDGRREFIGSLGESHVRDDIGRAADEWAIPVIYPLLDFEDAGAINISELWGLFTDPIRRASTRYGVNAVMAVRVWPAENNLWNARSLFLFQGQVYSEDFMGVTAQELSETVVSDAARHLADYYAVATNSSPDRPVRVRIDNVNDVESYAGLMAYMDGLTAVRSVTPVRVKDASVLLDVEIDGTMEQLNAAIGLGRRLSGVTLTFEPQERAVDWFTDLQYRWR